MIICFIACVASIIDYKFVKGNYTYHAEENDTIEFDKYKQFSLRYQLSDVRKSMENLDNTTLANFTTFRAMAVFSNTTDIKFENRYSFEGFSIDNNSFYFYYTNPDNLAAPKVLSKIAESILNQTINSTDALEIHEYLYKIITENGNKYDLSSIGFHSIEDLNITAPFMLNNGISGNFRIRNITLDILAAEFSVYDYIREGKVFGVIASFCIILNFYAWLSLTYYFKSSATCSQLSITSFIMHIAFEFSYGLNLFNFSLSVAGFRSLYSILFICCLIIYFTVQLRVLTDIWRSTNHMEDLDMNELRQIFFTFFGKVSVYMFFSSISFNILYMFPLFPIIYLYSSFIPQIIYSANNIQKKTGDTFFVIGTTLSRVVIIIYFFMYRNNIALCSLDFISASIGLVIAIGSAILIVLQNIFGGGFFIPDRFKPQPYDFHSSDPPPGTECAICMTVIEDDELNMVTPCHHYFHEECLQRWMQEQLVCPICRATLPN